MTLKRIIFSMGLGWLFYPKLNKRIDEYRMGLIWHYFLQEDYPGWTLQRYRSMEWVKVKIDQLNE